MGLWRSQSHSLPSHPLPVDTASVLLPLLPELKHIYAFIYHLLLITMWNSLPSSLVELEDTDIFKDDLYSHLFPAD